MKNKLKYRLGVLIILLFATIGERRIYAQLPQPNSFCSYAKSSSITAKHPNVHYPSHDAYDVHFYFLNLKAEANSNYIEGFTEVLATALAQNLDTVYLELSQSLIVDSVLFNQQSIAFQHSSNDILFFSPPQAIDSASIFIARIYYHGPAHNSGHGQGFNTADSHHGSMVSWTLSEPFYSKDWWPCKQDLQDKADSSWVFVTTNDKNKVGSNGLLTAVVPVGNHQLCYEWKSRYPIAYYLISIAVAEYMEYSFYTEPINGKSIWMQNFLYPDSTMYKSQKMLIDCTKLEMNLLREKYGEYPFAVEKYGNCISPIGGGMEHQTLTTQVNFSFHLSIHEMGHSWFGDHVTCKYWNDIWVNEGFATYSQYLGVENFADKATADAFMAGMQSVVMRKPDGSVYVPEDEIENRDRIFSGRLSYYKGAAIIHMIRYLLADDDLFFRVLQEYQKRFAFQSATGEDFKAVLEDVSGQDFDAFFNLWYYGEGFPVYDFEWNQYANNQLSILALQESSTPKSAFFDMKYRLKVYFTDGSDTTFQIHQQQQEQSILLALTKQVKAVIPNPDSWNLMEVRSVTSGLRIPGQVQIDPNPAHTWAYIRFANTNPNREIEVYNSSLQLIEKAMATDKVFRLNTSSYAADVYFIKVKTEGESLLKKLVKY